MNNETLDAALKELSRIAEALEEIAASKETIQQVIVPSEVKGYLRNGWKYVGTFGDGNMVVVEINEKERR